MALRMWIEPGMVAALAVALVTVGCASSSSKVNGDDQLVTDVTDDERRQICDWLVSQGSGYGSSYDCGGRDFRLPASRDACVAGLEAIDPAVCHGTVGDYKECIGQNITRHCDIAVGVSAACKATDGCFATRSATTSH